MTTRKYPYDDKTIATVFHNGNWLEKPWFLDEQPLLDHAGFPLHLRRRAAEQLAWLFPVEVCLEHLRDEDWRHFGTLFTPGALPVCELLELGLDVEVIGRFGDSKLLADLRHGKSFVGGIAEVSTTAFEVGGLIIAGAARPEYRPGVA